MALVTQQDWVSWNKDYLIAAVNLVRAKLERDEVSLKRIRAELQTLRAKFPLSPAFDHLATTFDLNPFEEDILLVCAGMETDSSFAQVVGNLHQDRNAINPTYQMLLSVFDHANWSAFIPEGPLQYWKLLSTDPGSTFTQNSVRLDPQILHYLFGLGISIYDNRLNAFIRPYVNRHSLADSHQKLAERLYDFFYHDEAQGNGLMVKLEGKNRKDKIHIAFHAAEKAQRTLYNLQLALLPHDAKELNQIARLLNRMVALTSSIFYIDLTQWSNFDNNSKILFRQFIDSLHGLVVIGCEESILNHQEKTSLSFQVHFPSRLEQQVLWKEELYLNGTSTTLLDQFSYQFNFEAETLRQLARQTRLKINHGENKLGDKEVFDQLYTECHTHTRHHLKDLAQFIDPRATWDDLVLPNNQKAILKEISIQIKVRQQVYDSWGFADKSHRGLGISALFAGESGTGKTMAAEVLANDLGLDVYKVDLSQVINKYVGETEKNLKKIFDAAELSGAILLFDESDALFGKRSEVKDSHDRHANIEVSYLLQRMESYRGLAILTTNMKTALDKAFMRRIRFAINFPFPDAALREEIWKRVFPVQTPTQQLNHQKLARLNVAGGNIKNIALNAAFKAAHQNVAITMHHIQEAAHSEYMKLDKSMSPSEYLV